MAESSSDGRHPVEVLAEDFLERFRRGEAPSVTDYARQHAELAGEIRDVFPALLVMEDVRPGDALPPDEAPVRLGDYEIVREIGRGGMGVVYEARQLSLGRRVALKVLPRMPALDSTRLRRFRNEALAAAQLGHPHIVDVYGVGSDQGQHFYVMRYIEGRTLGEIIAALRRAAREDASARPPHSTARNARQETDGRTRFGDSRERAGEPASRQPERSAEPALPAGGNFRLAARIGVQVAEALEHAHQQGVVHRDIKPSNLIVDAEGQVHVCDFGLAQIGTDATLTATGDLLGTLRYMSPEQALGRRRLIDHRTDIYSLGATLYELVTLQPAHCGEDRDELLRFLATQEPTAPRRLNRRVPADLETILLKAIAREPAERYASADELACDLKRFLENKPIAARRPSLMDRGSKWLRRHRLLSLSVVAVLLAALAGLALHAASLAAERTKTRNALDDAVEARRNADAQAELARRREREAVAARREAEAARQKAEVARRDAEDAAKEAEAVLHLLTVELLEQGAPDKALGRELTVRDLLHRAEYVMDNQHAFEPALEAALRHALGQVRYTLADYDPAARNLEQAAQLRELHLGPEHPQTLNTLFVLQSVYFRQYRLDEGERLAERVHAARRRILGEEHPQTLVAAQALAVYLARRDRLEEALKQYRRVLAAQERVLGEQHAATLNVLFAMGSAFEEQGDRESASQLFREILAVQEPALGPVHPQTLKTRAAVASLLRQRGSTAEALRRFEDILADQRRVLGDAHPETLDSHQEIAFLLAAVGRRDEALHIHRQLLETKRRVHGPEHPSTLGTTANLGSLLKDMRRYDEAREHLQAALEAQRRVLGPQHRHTLMATLNLAALFRAQGDSARALELHREALEGFHNSLGPDHFMTLAARSNVANCLGDLGKLDEARAELQGALSGLTRIRGPDHPATLQVMYNLAHICETSRHFKEACRLWEEVFERRLRQLGLEHADTTLALRRLLRLLEATGQMERARPFHVHLQILKRRAAESPVEAPVPATPPS